MEWSIADKKFRQEVQNAYFEGMEAGDSEDNPYPFDSEKEKHCAWIDGYEKQGDC